MERQTKLKNLIFLFVHQLSSWVSTHFKYRKLIASQNAKLIKISLTFSFLEEKNKKL